MSKRMLALSAAGVIAAIAIGVLLFKPSSQTETVASFPLLSSEELQTRADAGPEQGSERALSMTVSDGPGIKVAAPSGDSLKSPVDFDIQLNPRDGVAVDMSSLKIEYKLGPAWLNLTNRVMKEASVKGTRFYARGAELPPGKHSLRLSVKDVNGRATQAKVSITVN